MSLFVKITTFGGSPRFIHLRGLNSSVYKDSRGLLTTSNHTGEILFSIHKKRGHYTFIPKADLFLVENVLLEIDSETVVTSATKIKYEDYVLDFLPITHLAETLAYSNCNQPSLNPPLVHLEINLLNLHIQYPLPDDIDLILGKDLQCPLYIDLPSLQDRHCSIRKTSKGCYITPLEGKVSINDTMIEKETLLPSLEANEIYLLPGKIPVKISKHSGDK